MTEHVDYDYQELAYDLYHEGGDLLEKLVELRKKRHMTQADLAEKMNVSQGYISKIENGYADVVSLLTDYALEVGARLYYTVEPAEKRPNGDRAYESFSKSDHVRAMTAWSDGGLSIDDAIKDITYTVSQNEPDSVSTIVGIQELEKPEESINSSNEMVEREPKKEMAYAAH